MNYLEVITATLKIILIMETVLRSILKQDIKNIYHVNLQRDDAATMAHGVELRVPFLDKEVIKTAFRIPMKYKIESET